MFAIDLLKILCSYTKGLRLHKTYTATPLASGLLLFSFASGRAAKLDSSKIRLSYEDLSSVDDTFAESIFFSFQKFLRLLQPNIV